MSCGESARDARAKVIEGGETVNTTTLNSLTLSPLAKGLSRLALVALCAGGVQIAQAVPNHAPASPAPAKYRAESVHDLKWQQAHPNQPRPWIKALPHRYRIVKSHHQTYYFADKHYYQRSGAGYVLVK